MTITRVLAVAALAAAAACSKTEVTPVQPAGDPTPPEARMVRPTAVSGVYRLSTQITSRSGQQNQGRRASANMTLSSEAAAVPAAGAPSGAQYNATVTIPGYTKAPRGRSGQAAAWWPSRGDTVVVQFAQGTNGEIQLRGAHSGTTITGEIWYVSAETGSSFQLGTFGATKVR